MPVPGRVLANGVMTLAAIPTGAPSTAIERVRPITPIFAMPYTAPPAAPSGSVQDRYVPPQRVYSPSLGREVVVPPRYEGRPGSPPPVVTNPDGGQPTLLPPGSLPPVDRGGAP